jgi:hypothetical protein
MALPIAVIDALGRWHPIVVALAALSMYES